MEKSLKLAELAEFPENLADKNHHFVQIKNQYLRDIQNLIADSPISAQILFFFIEKMGRYNNSLVCSYQTLIEITGYSRSTIARSIKYLKDHNWIDTIKIGSATAYCVNAQVAWRAASNQRHYAIFSSTIVATSTEQIEDYLENKKLKHIPTEIPLKVEK